MAIFVVRHFTDKKMEIQKSLVTLEVAEPVNGKAGIQIQAGWPWNASLAFETTPTPAQDWIVMTGPVWGFQGGWVEPGAVFTGQYDQEQ